MFRYAVMMLLLVATPGAAQIQSRPTDPPLVTAVNESWYRLREPVQFAGDLYYPAGPAVFFDGNTMVRTGHYNGVPLYADTTIEPYSVVLVPIGRGLMQPYERLRRGDLAGTTASRAPSFPVAVTSDTGAYRTTAVPPTMPPLPIGAVSAFTAEATPAATIAAARAAAPIATMITAAGTSAGERRQEQPIVTLLKPENNDGLWIRYQGNKFVSAGKAVPLRASEFVYIGNYDGFPVFARRGQPRRHTIFLPTRAGLIAPYRLKDAVEP